MPRYVAFLRGVMPTNVRMPDLVRCFEAAGFTAVRTVLGSGNVIFDARTAAESTLERKAEKAMEEGLERRFPALVRSQKDLVALLDSDPFAAFDVAAGAKRVVTFLRAAPPKSIVLPPETQGARVLGVRGREVFTAYLRTAKTPVFMTLIQKTFGDDVTTRTWDTLRKCAAA